MKTAKEWIASVKDPVIKRYLEENVFIELIDLVKDSFESFVLGTFDWEETPQHLDFWFEVSKSDPSTLSYSDFKHLDKSVEQPKVSVNEDHRCTNYDPFGNCNCTQEVSVNEDAVEFKKEQILDAYRKGFSEGVCFGLSPTGYNHISADEYFNKTFKNC